MAFDGVFLHLLAEEINAALNSHIDKIYQPSKEELVLVLRKKGFVKRLLLSAKSGMARLQFTENVYENPEVPPMFCMLTRKHFLSARFTGVKLNGFERVAALCFENRNEMGDKTELKIICELIGTSANIILVNENNRIFDAVHRSDIEKGGRIIAPGAVYEPPERPQKHSIINDSAEETADDIFSKNAVLSSAILRTVDGVSPLIAREISFKISGGDAEISSENKALLKSKTINEINHLKKNVLSGGEPYILTDKDGEPKEFSFMPIEQYGNLYRLEKCESYSALLDRFYLEKEKISLKKRAGGDLQKLIKNLLTRAEKRKNLRLKEIESTKDREKLRIYGELLKANIYAVKSGESLARVQNFYDENGGYIDIPLDPALSPQNNAAKYFKEYKKSYNAEISLKKLIEKDKIEILYLESVEESLIRAESISDIKEIREELVNSGYITEKAKNGNKKKKPKIPSFLQYKSIEGYDILVGKNNTQNDYLTTVLASKNDLWFHTKNIHGAHVIVRCGGKEVSEDTLLYAATLAALNSRAAASSGVPVDYTFVKNVKKPSGAKAGMVIYTTNKTIFVTPGGKI